MAKSSSRGLGFTHINIPQNLFAMWMLLNVGKSQKQNFEILQIVFPKSRFET